jgi:hypothetical protein
MPPDQTRRGPASRPALSNIVTLRSTDEADRTTARLTFGRHSNVACRVRSFSTTPCHRCCRCRTDCHHPEFSELYEVAG